MFFDVVAHEQITSHSHEQFITLTKLVTYRGVSRVSEGTSNLTFLLDLAVAFGFLGFLVASTFDASPVGTSFATISEALMAGSGIDKLAL